MGGDDFYEARVKEAVWLRHPTSSWIPTVRVQYKEQPLYEGQDRYLAYKNLGKYGVEL